MATLTGPEKKILVGLISILVVLGTVTYLSHRNRQRINTGAEEINRILEIKYHLGKITQISSEFESGMRGFVITGNEEYLEPANKAIAGVFIHFGQLRSKASQDARLLFSINKLEQQVDRQITAVATAIELRRQKGITSAIEFVTASEGIHTRNNIRTLTDQLQQQQDELLKTEQEKNKTNILNFNTFFDLLLIKITIMVITVIFVLRYHFNARRKADRVIRENQEILQAIMDNTSSFICIKDPAGRYIHVNRQYEKLFLCNEAMVKGRTDRDFMAENLAEAIRQNDLEVIRNKRHMEFEEDLSMEGVIHHYISVKFPLFDKDRVVYAVCSVSTDITERKQSELLMKERSDSILDLFNNAPCGYHTLDKDGTVIEMNETELKWLGYSLEEVAGKMKIAGFLSMESQLIFDYHFARLSNRNVENVHDLEIRMKRKDGSILAVLLNVIGIYDEHGAFVRSRSSVFDITLRKQAEAIYSQN